MKKLEKMLENVECWFGTLMSEHGLREACQWHLVKARCPDNSDEELRGCRCIGMHNGPAHTNRS